MVITVVSRISIRHDFSQLFSDLQELEGDNREMQLSPALYPPMMLILWLAFWTTSALIYDSSVVIEMRQNFEKKFAGTSNT